MVDPFFADDLGFALPECNSEWQLVQCGDIPLSAVAERAACCAAAAAAPAPAKPKVVVATARPGKAPATSQGPTASVTGQATVARPDLDTSGSFYTAVLNFYTGTCTTGVAVDMPTFAKDASGQTQVRLRRVGLGWLGQRSGCNSLLLLRRGGWGGEVEGGGAAVSRPLVFTDGAPSRSAMRGVHRSHQQRQALMRETDANAALPHSSTRAADSGAADGAQA
jgi:hypothetical protein